MLGPVCPAISLRSRSVGTLELFLYFLELFELPLVSVVENVFDETVWVHSIIDWTSILYLATILWATLVRWL